jgi:hypothetical protein
MDNSQTPTSYVSHYHLAITDDNAKTCGNLPPLLDDRLVASSGVYGIRLACLLGRGLSATAVAPAWQSCSVTFRRRR